MHENAANADAGFLPGDRRVVSGDANVAIAESDQPFAAIFLAIDQLRASQEEIRDLLKRQTSNDGPRPVRQADGDQKAEENVEDAQIISEIAAYGAEMWLGLSNWAKDHKLLMGRERGLAYSVGDRLRGKKPLTIKQARWAKDILETAKEHGFDTELSYSLDRFDDLDIPDDLE